MFDPAGFRHGLGFALLANKNSILDPGIKPEQIAIDFRGVADKDQIALVPYAQGDACEVDHLDAPSHLAVENSRFEFRIMPLEGLRQLWQPEKGILRLEAALRGNRASVDAKELPYPWRDDAANVMTSRQEVLKGEGWRGIRWIAGYAQDGDYPWALGYVFEGITNDGRYFILIRASIAHPKQQRQLPTVTEANAKGVPIDAEMKARLEKVLAAAAPA